MSLKNILNSIDDKGVLRPLTVEESLKLKTTLLEAFLDIQNVCEKHGLTIMLVGGSALGAVRHHGYIPWDDDFDMAMPRADYNIFKQIFPLELSNKYILDAPNSVKDASNRFPKVLIKNTKLVELGMKDDENACIKLDLFIIENVPRNNVVRIMHGFICTFVMFAAGQVDFYEEQSDILRDFMYQTNEGKREYNRRILLGKLFSFLPSNKWFDIVDRICQTKKKTNLLGIPTGRKHYFGEILPYSAFLPASKGVFEGKPVSLPGNPDLYLKNLFGDYMVIPEESKREKHFICKIEFAKDT